VSKSKLRKRRKRNEGMTKHERENCPEQVFKMQRPMFGDMGSYLIYNENRDITVMLPTTDEGNALFGDAPKIFVRALIKDTIFIIEEVVPDPGW